MANVKITLSADGGLNKKNIYSDVDITSDCMESTLVDKKAVENSINNILNWHPRERIMNPGFGNTLWKRIFDNFSSFSQSDIQDEVRAMLSYEPRIEIESIEVDTNIENSEIYVGFTYTIPALNTYGKKNTYDYSITITNS